LLSRSDTKSLGYITNSFSSEGTDHQAARIVAINLSHNGCEEDDSRHQMSTRNPYLRGVMPEIMKVRLDALLLHVAEERQG
jgi:hypothetical protein